MAIVLNGAKHSSVYRIRMLFRNLIQFKPEKVLNVGSKLESVQFTTKQEHSSYPMFTLRLRLDEARGVLAFKISSIFSAKR